MSWSYSGNPSSSAKDEVRYLSGDTNQNLPYTNSDEEIAYQIAQWSGSPAVVGFNDLAAAMVCEQIMARLKSSLGDKTIGDLSISVNQTALTMFQDTAMRLRSTATLKGVTPYAGGTSVSEKAAVDSNPDLVEPAFKVGGMDKIPPVNQEPPVFGV